MREPKPGRKAGRHRGTKPVSFRVSASEDDDLTAASLSLGMTRGQFARWAALEAAAGVTGKAAPAAHPPAVGGVRDPRCVYDE